MLNQRINTNNSAADQATIDSLIEDLLHHKRQNSEDSGVGEGKLDYIFISSRHRAILMAEIFALLAEDLLINFF